MKTKKVVTSRNCKNDTLCLRLISFGILVGLAHLCSALITTVQADTLQLPLSSLSVRLPASAEEGREAIDRKPYGVVSVNERVLALPVEVSEAEDERLSVHSDVFDFYMLPITFGVAGFDGEQPKSFQIEVSLPERRVAASDIWIVDVFPRIEFVDGRISADANISVTGQLEITPEIPSSPIKGSAKVSGTTAVVWKYNPVFQSFAAVFSEATAIWTFDRVGDDLKAGPIDVRVLVAVKKDGRVANSSGVNLSARIRAEFTGGLFVEKYAGTNATLRVNL